MQFWFVEDPLAAGAAFTAIERVPEIAAKRGIGLGIGKVTPWVEGISHGMTLNPSARDSSSSASAAPMPSRRMSAKEVQSVKL